ncbi:MAG: DUF1902 domain-containing protein [Coriobacteriales bacterium]|jgi:hypothetical protein|nr:DUF1902 domain-containing protein [Coriobacteriales bacterium]
METIDVIFEWDYEAAVWIAFNEEVPLALEAGSLDVLMERVKETIPEIRELNGKSEKANVRFRVEKLLEAV